MLKIWFYFLILASVLYGCNKPTAQLPANKVLATDSLKEGLMAANELLIAGEDSILANLTKTRFSNMKKSEIGFWYSVSLHSKVGDTIKLLETCTIKYKLYTLDKELLTEKTEKIILGKKQTITGIEEAIKLIKTDDKVEALIPWYLAYGIKGDGENIGAYTSVYAEIELRR